MAVKSMKRSRIRLDEDYKKMLNANLVTKKIYEPNRNISLNVSSGSFFYNNSDMLWFDQYKTFAFQSVNSAYNQYNRIPSGQNFVQLDGQNDYFYNDWTTSGLDGMGLGTINFTIDMWVYPLSFSNYSHWFTVGDQNNFTLKSDVNTGLVYIYGKDGWTTYGSTPDWRLTLNAWNNIAFVRSGQTAYCYLNGNQVGLKTGLTANYDAWYPEIKIGHGWASEYTNGRIGQVRFYTEALTSQDLNTNFQVSRSTYGL